MMLDLRNTNALMFRNSKTGVLTLPTSALGTQGRNGDYRVGVYDQATGKIQPTLVKVGLNNTYLGAILLHAMLGLPFVIISVLAALQGFDAVFVQSGIHAGEPFPDDFAPQYGLGDWSPVAVVDSLR